MTKKQFVTKSGDTFEWEETPEAAEAIRKLNKSKFAGNYPGPLYAPHPHISQKISELEAEAPDYGVGK
tara:strand:+ start:435 stop:638 length:204 start_codon:yes stop_codon:yes gene_type:complete